jgi:hypothetical protein
MSAKGLERSPFVYEIPSTDDEVKKSLYGNSTVEISFDGFERFQLHDASDTTTTVKNSLAFRDFCTQVHVKTHPSKVKILTPAWSGFFAIRHRL